MAPVLYDRSDMTPELALQLLKDGISDVNANVPVMVIANEDQALEHIYANHQQGALYTIMCDVVTGALSKIKELKERENNS
ncbi:MAG: hypothetical protein EOO01_40315 [Chitinophagaceae bacterium]|nr:MAG: hypothetical protein EOO01_40315 [Chitinophagaceae bacterium]